MQRYGLLALLAGGLLLPHAVQRLPRPPERHAARCVHPGSQASRQGRVVGIQPVIALDSRGGPGSGQPWLRSAEVGHAHVGHGRHGVVKCAL